MNYKRAMRNISKSQNIEESKKVLESRKLTLQTWLKSDNCGNKKGDYVAELTLINLYLKK